MNKPELIMLEGELSSLSTAELIQLKNNPDLLGVWLTAALKAAKGAVSIGKKIGKARKKRKSEAKAAKVKKAATAARAPIPGSTSMPSRVLKPGTAIPQAGIKSPIIIIGAAIAALVLIMSQKK